MNISNLEELEGVLSHYGVNTSKWQSDTKLKLLRNINNKSLRLEEDDHGNIMIVQDMIIASVIHQKEGGTRLKLVSGSQHDFFFRVFPKYGENNVDVLSRECKERGIFRLEDNTHSAPQMSSRESSYSMYSGITGKTIIHSFEVYISYKGYRPSGYVDKKGQHFRWEECT